MSAESQNIITMSMLFSWVSGVAFSVAVIASLLGIGSLSDWCAFGLASILAVVFRS